MELEPTTFDLVVQRRYPLRHGGSATMVTSVEANHIKIVSPHSQNNIKIFFEINIYFLE